MGGYSTEFDKNYNSSRHNITRQIQNELVSAKKDSDIITSI